MNVVGFDSREYLFYRKIQIVAGCQCGRCNPSKNRTAARLVAVNMIIVTADELVSPLAMGQQGE